MERLSALGPLRHACLACGGSCTGTLVTLRGEEERERIARLAAELGVDDPIVDGRLRREDGACVFLDDHQLCRIHGAFGGPAKPAICRQFPVVLVETEAGRRIGVDPACYTAMSTWLDGDEPEPVPLAANSVHYDEERIAMERRVLGLLTAPGLGVAACLCVLAGLPPGDGLPDGLLDRLTERWRAGDVGALLTSTDAGRHLGGALAPLVDHVASRPTAPWPGLSPGRDGWALEAARRMVFLRLASTFPAIQGIAWLTLAGAALIAEVDLDDDAFGRALAGWCRAIRRPPMWHALTPDPTALAWLVTGDPALAPSGSGG